jgi:hypothetical protein
MKRFILFGLILIFATAACSAISPQAEVVVNEDGLVTIFALDG